MTCSLADWIFAKAELGLLQGCWRDGVFPPPAHAAFCGTSNDWRRPARCFQPETMEALSQPGFYAAGEVLDVDALTGGFNLQVAWSTGYLAGTSAAGSNKGE